MSEQIRKIRSETVHNIGNSAKIGAEIIEKMVNGRLRKYYEEVVLGEQIYVIDGENKVNRVIELASKEINVPIRISGFKRFELGEGIEKREEDFAAEVAAQVEN